MEQAEIDRLTAEAGADGKKWLELGQALGQARRFDEAGHALLRARALGAAIEAALDAIALPALEEVAVREIGTRFKLGKQSLALWSADGRTLYTMLDRKGLLAWDPATGANKVLGAVANDANALGRDLLGKKLAVAFQSVERPPVQLSVVDVETGRISEPIGRGHKWIKDVAIDDARGLVLCAEKDRARGYALVNHNDKATWSITAAALGMDGAGYIAWVDGKGLGLNDPLAKKARVEMALDVPKEALKQLILKPAGRRAVIVAEDIILLEANGSLLGRAPLPAGQAIYDVIPSPSGRHLAILFQEGNRRTTRLDLLDIVAHRSRTVLLESLPRDPAWSPSGRRLAIPTDQGTVIILEARDGEAPAPAPEAASTAGDEGWLELRTPERFWRARRVGSLVEIHHGLVGARGTRAAHPCLDEADAERELARRRAEKEKDGYVKKG